MLVLTRREAEKIIILCAGRRIEVSIDEAKHGKAKVGVSAPWDVGVWRDEFLAELTTSPACLANPNILYTTLCGKPWKSGDRVLGHTQAEKLPGYICRRCEERLDEALETPSGRDDEDFDED